MESPYSEIVALLPLVEEVEGSSLDADETAELRENLISALRGHLPSDPAAVLGGQDLSSFMAARPVETLSAEEVLACFGLLVFIAQIMGGNQMHAQLLSGEIGNLLPRLNNISPAA